MVRPVQEPDADTYTLPLLLQAWQIVAMPPVTAPRFSAAQQEERHTDLAAAATGEG
ncbi:MAG TPA: hypothetical protein VH540_15605 [Ktedonobacterales bacterium]|jgi:hypothetical protein